MRSANYRVLAACTNSWDLLANRPFRNSLIAQFWRFCIYWQKRRVEWVNVFRFLLFQLRIRFHMVWQGFWQVWKDVVLHTQRQSSSIMNSCCSNCTFQGVFQRQKISVHLKGLHRMWSQKTLGWIHWNSWKYLVKNLILLIKSENGSWIKIFLRDLWF